MPERGEGFGDWLRETIARRNVRLSDVARAARCDYSYLWRLTRPPRDPRRRARPSYEMARRIGEALGAELEALHAAGYARPAGFPHPQIDARLARLETELAELRRLLASAADGGTVRLPLMGSIRAGDAHEALAAPDDWLDLPAALARDSDFLLRVRGDSMAPTLVEGDLVLIRRTDHANPGQIVAALVDGAVTLKRFELRGGVPTLVPDNEAWPPVACGPETRILGIVTGSFRPGEVLERRRW